MERIPEPELMDDPAQARAYAEADFEAPHAMFVELFRGAFPGFAGGRVLDLGCGPGDITLRLARAFPDAYIDGVDGAAAMLDHARAAVRRADLDKRIGLHLRRLPDAGVPGAGYDAVVSNSLLHHLHAPEVLWEAVRRAGRPEAAVFVMDLRRPASEADAHALVESYAADEPEVLRRDFYNSLLAAFTEEEVREQLRTAGLDTLEVRTVSDRHLTVQGRLGK